MTLHISEIFTSIQGEGIRAGVPATFIRLQGCDIGCPFCDTKYAWKSGGSGYGLTEEMIVARVKAPYAVITGGEPLMQDIMPLVVELYKAHKQVQIETSGKYWQPDLGKISYITLSPKPILGYDFDRRFEDIVDEVKLVVDEGLDEEIIRSLMTRINGARSDNVPFVLMPESYSWKPYPIKPDMARKAYELVLKINSPYVRYGDRLQSRLEVK